MPTAPEADRTAPRDEAVPFPSVPGQRLDPDPLLARFREECPVARIRAPYGGEAWIVTRYADVRTLLNDPRLSRSALVGRDTARATPFPMQPDTITSMDPPDHTRVRRLASQAFTPRRVEGLRPRAYAIVEELLDNMVKAGPPGELIEGLALPLPIIMICELLGVPLSDRADFREWAATLLSTKPVDEIIAANQHLQEYLADMVQRRRQTPSDDLLGALVSMRDDDRLTEPELVSLAMAILVGGFETTANHFGKLVFRLLSVPDDWERLVQDPSLVRSAVEESLRYIPLSAGSSIPRIATEEIEVGGALICPGDVVVISNWSANRDETVFADADTFDITRDPNPHMGFSHGPHWCLGAHLARMELQVGLDSLVRRLPQLRLAVPVSEVPWKQVSAVWGLRALPVDF